MSTEIDKVIEQINEHKEIRQALSRMRALIKEDGPKQYFVHAFSGKFQTIIGFLESDDAKTRKNAALLLGDVADVLDEAGSDAQEGKGLEQSIMKALFAAYENERQLFVKSSYLAGFKNYDYREYLETFSKRKKELLAQDVEESDQKHVNEEIHTLDTLIITMQGLKKHQFSGGDVMSDLVLLTNRKHVETVAEQVAEAMDTELPDENIRIFSAGVMAHTDRIAQIMELRTVQEMLYQVKGMVSLPMDSVLAAKRIAESSIMDFLRARHDDGNSAFYFRVELKANMDLSEKSTFIKKMSNEIERLTDRKLVNNKSHYEIEFRLIETKSGKFNCLVKLYTQNDNRFLYRKCSVASSIKPENAALLVELAKEYLRPDAQVLDPFCGTGTLLIERQKVVKANTSYGIDIYGEAVEGAKINTEAAGQIIHYINKDFFEFEHEYLFDEIFTDMPFETGHKDIEEIEEIYRRFFVKALEHLTSEGRMIMYTHNREFAEKYAKEAGFKMLCHEIILEKAGTDLYVFENTPSKK